MTASFNPDNDHLGDNLEELSGPELLAYARKIFSLANRAEVLALLANEGPLLRSDIMEKLGYNSELVGRITTDLEQAGIVYGDLAPERRRGRSVKYSVNVPLYRKVWRVWTDHLAPKRYDDGPAAS